MSNDKSRVESLSTNVLNKIDKKTRMITAFFYVGALVLGVLVGMYGSDVLNNTMNYITIVFTRLFSFIAVPIIALALITTLAKLGKGSKSGLIFKHTIFYTLFTTILAAIVAAILFSILRPENVPAEVSGAASAPPPNATSYVDHILSIVPNNILQPFVSGNVLSVLIIAAFFGVSLALMEDGDKKKVLLNFFEGLQDILFTIIKAIIFILPLGILGFTAQLTRELEAGILLDGLVTYFTVVVGSNLIQMFVILPLLMLARGLNPLKVARGMLPAVTVALFSKSSAGTLPVTLASAEDNLKVHPKISRFVLPICTTINMNGCAAFILVTSIYLMQNAGYEITTTTIITWIFISTIAAVGNAGVPMGCYFLTISLLSSMQVPVLLMGVILPVYAVIDMIETSLNVWSDATVANIVNKELKDKIDNDDNDTKLPESELTSELLKQ